jgi:hypothetical protein
VLTAVGDYAWIITADHVTQPGDGLASQAGWTGPSDLPDDLQDQLKGGHGQPILILDDDGVVCYHGRYLS